MEADSAFFSSKDTENSDETNVDNDEQPAVISHAEAASRLDELMVYFERQAETTQGDLLMLKGCMHDHAAHKWYSKLMQQKLTTYFKK